MGSAGVRACARTAHCDGTATLGVKTGGVQSDACSCTCSAAAVDAFGSAVRNAEPAHSMRRICEHVLDASTCLGSFRSFHPDAAFPRSVAQLTYCYAVLDH